MENLLSKLDSIQVNKYDQLSAEDQNFVTKMKAEYAQTHAKLVQRKHEFEALRDSQPEIESNFKTTDYNSVYFERATEPEWFNRYEFSFQYPIMHIGKLLENLEHKAISDVIYYFKASYGIKMEVIDYERVSKKSKNVEVLYDLDHVIDWILFNTGGVSLAEKGIGELKHNFTDSVNWSREGQARTKLSKSTVTLISYAYYHNNWNGSKKTIEYNNSNYIRLVAALAHFENGGTKNQDFGGIIENMSRQDSVNFEEPYYTPADRNLKLVSVRWFKNGKVELKFKTDLIAREFVNYYSLETEKAK